jgi:hypothetical protein
MIVKRQPQPLFARLAPAPIFFRWAVGAIRSNQTAGGA